MPCLPRINHGEVPLGWKERPTCPNPVVTVTGENDRDSLGEANGEAGADGKENEGIAYNGRHESGSNETSKTSEAKSPQHQSQLTESIEVNVTYPEWCISTRGEVDVAPIVNLILQGVDDPTPPPPPKTSRQNGSNSNNNDKTEPKSRGFKNGNKAVNQSKLSSKNSSFSTSNLWNEQNAATNNVRITRPSHDAWGIKKIMLVFCDDFMHTIYTLPWYQPNSSSIGNKMHKAIQPILETLGIRQECMVRCLLAGLPPGVTIPIHHDTGEWVKYTHRVHVPIIVPDPTKVLFRCGPTEQSMERVDCTPGHVFEMNNQAKHAVTNGHETRFRVHLILDYVDPAFFAMRKTQKCEVRRVNLTPGEVVTQTRRSIDRASEAGSRPQPSFLILGAQKAGTTSLYEYLNQHPWVVKPKRRETHCLDWRWDDSLQCTEDRRKHCLSFYHDVAMRPYPSLRTGDSTPSYLLDYYRVIPRLKECFNHGPKLIILTRDPIKRAVSQYVMVTSSDGTPEQLAVRGAEWRDKSLEEVLEQDMRNMKEDGLLPYWDMDNKTVDREMFEKFVDSREENEAWERYVRTRIPLNTGSYSPLARGLYALQCRQWFRSFSKDTFLVLKMEDMSSLDKGVQWVVDVTLKHLELPQFKISDVEKKNSRSYDDPLGKETRAWLERFFAPQNERFGRVMVEEMGYLKEDWWNPWSYG